MEEIAAWVFKQIFNAGGGLALVLALACLYLMWQRKLDRDDLREDRATAKAEAVTRADIQTKQADAILGFASALSRIEGILLGTMRGPKG